MQTNSIPNNLVSKSHWTHIFPFKAFVNRKIDRWLLCLNIAIFILILYKLVAISPIFARQTQSLDKSSPSLLNSENLSPSLLNTTLQFCIDSTGICGKPFSKRWLPYIEKFRLADYQIAEMTYKGDRMILHQDPIFVTAFSDNHFEQSQNMLETFRRHFPTKKMIVYDLGLNSAHVSLLKANRYVQEVRRFRFEDYPSYVRNLKEYRWKPLIIAELLLEHQAVFYADAHITWLSGFIRPALRLIRCPLYSKKPSECHNSAIAFSSTGHSIFAATDKRLYDYLPIKIELSKKLPMCDAGLQLIYGTSVVKRELFKWNVLCALEENCMGPPNSTVACAFSKDMYNDYANCHRYDQSAISILMLFHNHYDWTKNIIPFPFTRKY